MPHAPKPFYRSARNGWYVQLPAGQRRLTTGPNTAATHKEAWESFHAIMAGTTPESPDGLSVASVLDQYVEWVKAERSARTFKWTLWHAQSFCNHLKLSLSPAALPAPSLKPHHLTAWSLAHPTWGANQRRGAISCVQRAFAWATRQGLIDRDPVAGMKKPAPTRREQYTTPEAFASLLTHFPEGDPFRDYLEFLWETGCRPLEARQLEPPALLAGAPAVRAAPGGGQGQEEVAAHPAHRRRHRDRRAEDRGLQRSGVRERGRQPVDGRRGQLPVPAAQEGG